MRAAQVGAGKLVLALEDAVDQRLDVERIAPERPRRHLPVHDLRR